MARKGRGSGSYYGDGVGGGGPVQRPVAVYLAVDKGQSQGTSDRSMEEEAMAVKVWAVGPGDLFLTSVFTCFGERHLWAIALVNGP